MNLTVKVGRILLEELSNEPRHYYSLMKTFARRFSAFAALQAPILQKERKKQSRHQRRSDLNKIAADLLR